MRLFRQKGRAFSHPVHHRAFDFWTTILWRSLKFEEYEFSVDLLVLEIGLVRFGFGGGDFGNEDRDGGRERDRERKRAYSNGIQNWWKLVLFKVNSGKALCVVFALPREWLGCVSFGIGLCYPSVPTGEILCHRHSQSYLFFGRNVCNSITTLPLVSFRGRVYFKISCAAVRIRMENGICYDDSKRGNASLLPWKGT